MDIVFVTKAVLGATFLVVTIVFLRWFLRPVYYGMKKEPILKDYEIIDGNKSTSSDKKSLPLFPTINEKPTKSLTIVVPAYNEEKRIGQMLTPCIQYLQKRSKNAKKFDWEIIVVNDGSTDSTCDVVRRQYIKKYGTNYVRLLSYDENQGKGYAIQQGMLHARGCFILFADADGASEINYLYDLEKELIGELNRYYGIEGTNEASKPNLKTSFNARKTSVHSIINYHKYCDYNGISIGSRKDLQQKAEADRTFLRNITMWGFHACVKYIGGVKNIRDTQCGFKLFTRKAVQNIFIYQKIRGWCFDVELLMIGQMQNMPMIEVGIKWKEIANGKLSVVKASLCMFRELLIIRFFKSIGKWYKFE